MTLSSVTAAEHKPLGVRTCRQVFGRRCMIGNDGLGRHLGILDGSYPRCEIDNSISGLPLAVESVGLLIDR